MARFYNAKRWLVPCLVATGAAAQEAPVIRVDTRLVEVDVVVRNGKGPVAGLTKEDFTLSERGKPQQIALFKVTDARTAGITGVPPAPLPPGTVSNRGTQNGDTIQSATVVLVDHLNTPTDAQIYGNKQLLRFLESSKKGDRIAIYLLSETKLEVLQNFTTDPERLKQAASNLKPEDTKLTELLRMLAELSDPRNRGRGPASDPVKILGPQLEEMHIDNVAATAESLTAIAKNLGGLPGRKNLVWISSNFPAAIQLQSRQMQSFAPQLQEATRMLNEANVAVYPIDPRGVVTGFASAAGAAGSPPDPLVPEASNEIVTMNAVAQATGGRAFYHDNGVSAAIREAIEDGEVTYTLGFYPDKDSLDGTFHDLRVKVAKGGMEVRYRKGYFAADTPSLTEKQLRDGLKEALRSPLDATAVGLTASEQPDPTVSGRYTLTAMVNINDVRMQRNAADASWTGSIAVAFRSASDTSPEVQFAVVPVKLNDEQYKTALREGYGVRGTLNTAGPVGGIHVLVQDRTTGASGTVWIPVPPR